MLVDRAILSHTVFINQLRAGDSHRHLISSYVPVTDKPNDKPTRE